MTDAPKGEAVPENSPKVVAPPTPDPTPPPEAQIGQHIAEGMDRATAGFSQKDINKAAGKARDEGRQAALRELLGDLGVDSPETLKQVISNHREAEEAKKSDAEKMAKALEKAAKERDEAQSSKAAATQAATEMARRSEAQLKAITSGVKPERIQAVLKLADLSDVEVSDDFSVDGETVLQRIEAVLEEYPEFAATGANRNIGSGSNPPTDPPDASVSVNQMSREQFEDMKNRALQGEKLIL